LDQTVDEVGGYVDYARAQGHAALGVGRNVGHRPLRDTRLLGEHLGDRARAVEGPGLCSRSDGEHLTDIELVTLLARFRARSGDNELAITGTGRPGRDCKVRID